MASSFATEAKPLSAVELPTFLNHHAGIDDEISPGMAAAKRCMIDVLKKAEGVNARRQMVDPTMTFGAHLVGVDKAVGDYQTYFSEKFKSANAALANSTKDMERLLDQVVGIKPTPDASRIQDRLVAMSAKDRQAALAKAFSDDDKALIGAIVGVHPILHGCDAKQVDSHYDAYRQRVAGPVYDKLLAHRKAAEWMAKAERFALEFAGRAYQGTTQATEKAAAISVVLATYDI